jgi:cysteine desulfurase
MKSIYADHNATTPLCMEAVETMRKAMETWGNPSSAHRPGRLANQMVNEARMSVARAAGVKPLEVVFTSGGSEANTLALMGSFFTHTEKPFRLLTSRVEHSSVRDTVELLRTMGTEVEFVSLEKPSGELRWDDFKTQVAEFKPHLISLMSANNETGVCFPISEIREIAKTFGSRFHTDAVQAFGKLAPRVWEGVDFVSISAHKIHGPKGIGALLERSGRQLIPTHYGGSQEVKRRGGTENVIGIAGFGASCAQLEPMERIGHLRDRFEKTLIEKLSQISVQGREATRVPNTSNVRFENVASEVLLGALDMEGVSVSAGSACSSGSIIPSHVLLELGFSKEEARECLRFSWGKDSTEAEVDTVAALVINHVERIRARRATQRLL